MPEGRVAMLNTLLSEIEDEPQAHLQRLHGSRPQLSAAFNEKTSIQSDKLRHVGDGVFGKTRLARCYAHVARRIRKREIRSKNDRHDRADATFVECVRLNDYHRSPKSGLRCHRVRQRRPPYLAAPDYQVSSRGRERS